MLKAHLQLIYSLRQGNRKIFPAAVFCNDNRIIQPPACRGQLCLSMTLTTCLIISRWSKLFLYMCQEHYFYVCNVLSGASTYLVFSRNARIAPSPKVAYLHPDRTFQM